MNINDFYMELDKQFHHIIPKEMSDVLTIDKVEVVKFNDEELHGLTFKTKDRNAAPTFYVDAYFEDFKAGRMAIADISSDMFSMYLNSREYAPTMTAAEELDFSFETIKDKLSIRVLDPNRNKLFLADKPYFDIDGGLAAIVDINLGKDYRTVVNDNVLEQIGVDKGVLYETALENMASIDAPVLCDMTSAIFGDRENILNGGKLEPWEVGQMYVLTNESGISGAAYVTDPEILKKAADVLGSSYYVLPSSIHEVLLLPGADSHSLENLHDMVLQANRTVVDARDVLSDDVFFYDSYEHSFKNLTADVKVEEEETYDDDLDI